MCPLTLTSLKSLVFPNKILSISVVCSIILPSLRLANKSHSGFLIGPDSQPGHWGT